MTSAPIVLSLIPRSLPICGPNSNRTLKAGANLADVVKAINALGANPQDLISILQSMKAAGALRAELEVI